MTPQGPSAFVSLIPFIAIFAIFYFLLIRPQQKQQAEHEKMLAALKKGDRVLTSGGIYGTIVALKGADMDVKVADNVKLLVSRTSVTRLAPEGDVVPAGN